MTEPATNGWKNLRVTVGLLLAVAVGMGMLVGAMQWTSTRADEKVTKAIGAHDHDAQCHQHLQRKMAKAHADHATAAKESRAELRQIRELVVRQQTTLELVLLKRRRRRAP